MNRIQHAVEDDLDCLIPTVPAASELAPAPLEEESAHCIFTPMHYERHYAYPLIVWLHGPDDDERQITRVLPLVSTRNYVGVGPRGTLALDTPGTFAWSQDPRHIALAESRVMAAVAAVRRRLNVSASRIYLAGFDCGGTMALRIALNQPSAFAGVMSIGGAFPNTLRPLAQLRQARRLSFVLAAGRHSQDYPEERLCADLRLCHAANLPVCVRQYVCCDDLTTHMLSDMNRWVMGQLTTPEPLNVDEPSHRHGGN